MREKVIVELMREKREKKYERWEKNIMRESYSENRWEREKRKENHVEEWERDYDRKYCGDDGKMSEEKREKK